MKAVIPAAGIGKRLRPHTYSVPKALLNVAGKPILGHIVDNLMDMGIDELIPIIGYQGDCIRDYLEETYSIPMNFVVQEQQKGIAHAVSMTRDLADNSELVIVLGDTIIDADFVNMPSAGEYVLGVHEVEDPQRFGICEVEDNVIRRIVEKPEQPKGNLALIGVYYFKNSTTLYQACAEIMKKGITTKGEFQITDALQMMVEKGIEFRPYTIGGWYDCGTVDKLLETNRVLLNNVSGERAGKNVVIIAPCYISEDSKIENSVIGPHVTVAEGCEISSAVIKNSIINKGASLRNVVLESSVVGSFTEVDGHLGKLNVGDRSRISQV
jgi:glucose-1-phosphate thymidylyltransferase